MSTMPESFRSAPGYQPGRESASHTTLASLRDWVHSVAELTQPSAIQWCDGSDAENTQLVELMLATGDLVQLNPTTHPNCFLHRSSPSDVARVEHLTFVCTPDADEAGPNNHWMAPTEAHAKMDALFAGCMRGRTLYVVPYCMGPIDSPLARCGVEITDSPYVVANMRIMTRMGADALARIEREGVERADRGEREDTFVRGLHSIGELDPERRFIMHFPHELSIKSYGSGYGGKTNLAMLIPPEGYRREGWKVWTVGDDICWMRPGKDGRLWAINPEAGFFGVAPGTSAKTNSNALAMLDRDAIFTNVALTADGQPWWEGLPGEPATDWQGRPYDPANGPAAHPNSRFTVSAHRCPSFSAHAEDAEGVPLSAIIFGGRRESLVPLVFEARDWAHGVLVGAGMASETTAAATGAVGVVRRDPMAMKPFVGYNFGDYFAHWLAIGKAAAKPPAIFHVNWFRKGSDGKFLWPGFGDNLRVLEWMLRRVAGDVGAVETPIGNLPVAGDINADGLGIDAAAMQQLLQVDRAAWQDEMTAVGQYLADYGTHAPAALIAEQQRIAARLG